MDTRQFDDLTRSLSSRASRRGWLTGLAGGLVTLLPAALGIDEADAKKNGKRKKKRKQQSPPLPPLPPPILNAFGCVDVGQACRGDSTVCCSGICQGAPPAQGQPDSSVCVAHNVGGCTPERNACTSDNLQASFCNENGVCVQTTGGASFCANPLGVSSREQVCLICAKDTDCEALGFPPGSACVLVRDAPNCNESGDTCVGINGSGTACFPPGAP